MCGVSGKGPGSQDKHLTNTCVAHFPVDQVRPEEEEAKAGVYWAREQRCFLSWGCFLLVP